MEKHIATYSYWLGLLCAALSILLRALNTVNVLPTGISIVGVNPLSYLTFFRGAELFLLVAIATRLHMPKS